MDSYGFLVTPVADDEHDGEVRVGVVEAERPNPENTKTRHVIYSNKVEQKMIKDETTSHRLMVIESADAGVFMNPSTPEWELNKWMEGLSKELDTMEVKNVLEKAPQSKFPNAKPVPSKLVLTKKPMEDSEVIIKSDMGASEIAAIIQQAWNPRVRLVACGNFEKDSKAHDPENFAGNPGAETVRILLSLLARRPTNMTAVVLDISCAFLGRRRGPLGALQAESSHVLPGELAATHAGRLQRSASSSSPGSASRYRQTASSWPRA